MNSSINLTKRNSDRHFKNALVCQELFTDPFLSFYREVVAKVEAEACFAIRP
jgi:hypothetical protein